MPPTVEDNKDALGEDDFKRFLKFMQWEKAKEAPTEAPTPLKK